MLIVSLTTGESLPACGCAALSMRPPGGDDFYYSHFAASSSSGKVSKPMPSGDSKGQG